jgi:hypothetical protein
MRLEFRHAAFGGGGDVVVAANRNPVAGAIGKASA